MLVAIGETLENVVGQVSKGAEGRGDTAWLVGLAMVAGVLIYMAKLKWIDAPNADLQRRLQESTSASQQMLHNVVADMATVTREIHSKTGEIHSNGLDIHKEVARIREGQSHIRAAGKSMLSAVAELAESCPGVEISGHLGEARGALADNDRE